MSSTDTLSSDANTGSAPNSSNSSCLCQRCINEGVPELLERLRQLDHQTDDQQDDDQQNEAGFMNQEHHGDSSIQETIGHTANNESKTENSFNVSITVGGWVGEKGRACLGSVKALLDRKGCSVCDIVKNVLPTTSKYDLSDLKVLLVFCRSASKGPYTGTATIADDQDNADPSPPDPYKLHIILTVASIAVDEKFITLGCIQSYTPQQDETILGSPDHAQQDPTRDNGQHLPVSRLPQLLRQIDAPRAALEYLDKFKSFHGSKEERRKALEPLTPLFEAMMMPTSATPRKPENDGKNWIRIENGSRDLTSAYLESYELIKTKGQHLITTPQTEFRILLIDVEEYKLVEKTISTTYLALSYVWGNAEVFKTYTSNRRTLESSGSLRDVRLPRIVTDAIVFTKKIGVRYLWVDALCIEQNDDSSQKPIQIKHMDDIYHNAYLTLVAWTAKNSGSSLPGVTERLRPQVIQREVNGMTLESRLSTDMPYLVQYTIISHYDTRAWTFQERKLSKRCIFFHERDALFIDQETKHFFAIGSFQPLDRGNFNRLGEGENMSSRICHMAGNISSSVPKLEKYAQLVEEYTALNLTMMSDRLNAFTGLLSRLRPDIGETVSGLPIPSSPFCLCWMSVEGQQQRNPGFPSWSWTGWQCKVSYIDWAGDDWDLQVKSISGSKQNGDVPKLLWSSKNDTSMVPVDYDSIKILHFSAWIVHSAMDADGHFQPSQDHACILLKSRKKYRGDDIEVMEIKRVGECAERVSTKRSTEKIWSEMNPQWEQVHLQ